MSQISPGDTPRQSDSVEVERLEDELLVYRQEDNKLHNLNGTAAFVWLSCDGDRTVAEIGSELAQQFPEQPDQQIKKDVLGVVEDLKDKGLLT